MTVIERLKLELNHKDYFEDTELIVFLSENTLTATDTYDKSTMQRNLLLTVVDILEAVSNDVDLMRKVEDTNTGLSIGDAYKLLQDRIKDIQYQISAIPLPTADNNEYSNVSLLFTNQRGR